MIEALKQALDAFHQIFESTIPYREDGTCTINDKSIELSNKAIASLRQAIAELESQEAVAYLCEPDEDGLFDLPTPDKGCKDCFPVYRHPQRTEQEPWCMKMNGCTAKCEDCPDEPPPTPQRTWAGLAKEDRLCAKYMQDAPDGIEAVIDYIEAKLKELNT